MDKTSTRSFVPAALPAVIVAGGLGRRLGGQVKCLLPLGGRAILDHLLDRLGGQAGPLALNSNDPAELFRSWALPVLADGVPDRPGPLAGILAALDWAAGQGARQVLTVPGDTPFLPRDLVRRFEAARAAEGLGAAHAAMAMAGGKPHPLIGIWPVGAADQLRAALLGGLRRVSDWAALVEAIPVEFEQASLFNINSPADLAMAGSRLLDR